MKTNKPKVQKKVAKKAGKKELAKTLADRFFQVMNEFGKEAEKMGLDIGKVGLSAVKKLTSKLSGEKSTKKASTRNAKDAKKAIVEHIKPAKKAVKKAVEARPKETVEARPKETAVKNDGKVNPPIRNAAPKARAAAQSVKVIPILTEENAAKAIAKKAPVKKTAKTPQKPKADEDVKS